MSSVNKVTLIGRLGKDPEVKDANGTPVANFSLATSETWKDKDSGEKKEKVEWHRLVAWGRQAEIIGQYLTKGSLIYVEGQLQTRSYRNENEEKDRYTTEIRVGMMKMLGSKGDTNGGTQAPEPVGAVAASVSQSANDDDIPF